MSEALDIYT